jgi:hypothetical protein
MTKKASVHHYHHHKHHNLFLLFISIVVAIVLSRSPLLQPLILSLSNYGYFGAFLAGMFLVSTFTVTLGGVLVTQLSQHMSPIGLALSAGAGAVCGDFLIFHFVRNNILEDITPIYKKVGGSHLNKILHTHYFSWTLPVIGAFFLISPLPDEIGISLMGISAMKARTLFLISYTLHSTAIFFLSSGTQLFHSKPF